jgi:hypothetical protein
VNHNKVILIHWVDACIHGSETVSSTDASRLGLITCVSAGVLIHEDEEKITIGMDYFVDHDTFRTVQTYPKSGIVKVTLLDIQPA